MLTLTENAVRAVKGIVESSPTVPDSGGIRLAPAEGQSPETRITVTVTAVPSEDDQVVDEEGARVFLDQGVAVMLEDKVLDAAVRDQGVSFMLVNQAP